MEERFLRLCNPTTAPQVEEEDDFDGENKKVKKVSIYY
jgi:hypothetical protein